MWRALPWLFAVTLSAQDAVRILESRCVGCHNAKTKQGGLDLSSRTSFERGGTRGPAASTLLDFVNHRRQPAMPLGAPKLPAAELETLEKWIRSGAPFAGPITAAPHWAFQPVRRPSVPAATPNAVDFFLAAERDRRGLPPVAEAPKPTLLRRVTLDLTGLPPTPAELQAFLADTAPGAYERVVDRLLASPRYGERWGRHWMDIWRYSDWYGSGAEVRNSQPHIWRWRDWIIESLNANKPYDEMVRQMLAADELSPADPAALRATGFLVRNWFLFNRNVWMQDTIEGVTAGFLGLTLKCARCHDHKYDPLSQEDYYRFRAFFEPHDIRLDRVAGEADLKKAGLARAYDAAPRADQQNAAGTFILPAIFGETYLFQRGDERSPDKAHPLTPATPPALGAPAPAPREVPLPLESYYPDLRPEARDALLAAARRRIDTVQADAARIRRVLAEAREAKPWAKPAGPAIDFDKQVKPLLEARCGSCHFGITTKGGFSVGTRKSIENGGRRLGAAILPGKSAESPLIRILKGAESPRMPLNGPPLAPAEIDLLAAWIDGLEPPDPAVVARDAEAKLAVNARELLTAQAQWKALEARAAAETAKYASSPDAAKLAESARSEELRAAAVAAEENVFRAQQRLTEALSAGKLDEGKVNAARRALEQAVEALNNPKEGYSPLGPQYPKTSTGRRTALAAWMTARTNPLTARVAVNHIWLRHFGAPLVASVTDFGRNGKTPTHPALLDWLAAEFMDSGWDMKRLHKTLVTSAAYRLQSHGAQPKDPDNKWYWRANPRRLEAEAIRDSVLFTAGALDETRGGPELNEETQSQLPRRSLYFRVTPDAQLQFLKVFDGVDPTACFARAESIVPQQALALTNSELTLRHARQLAAQLDAEPDFVAAAFLRVLARPPSSEERELSARFLSTGGTRANLIHALFNRNEFVTLR